MLEHITNYLNIYQKNCEILLNNKKEKLQQSNYMRDQLDFYNQLSKNEFKFYDLSDGYYYGEADEEIKDFFGEDENFDPIKKKKLCFQVPEESRP